jgi:hypothetical protein
MAECTIRRTFGHQYRQLQVPKGTRTDTSRNGGPAGIRLVELDEDPERDLRGRDEPARAPRSACRPRKDERRERVITTGASPEPMPNRTRIVHTAKRRPDAGSGVFDVTLCPINGSGEIRTHGTLSRTHTFQACALNHSATDPTQHPLACTKRADGALRRPSAPGRSCPE